MSDIAIKLSPFSYIKIGMIVDFGMWRLYVEVGCLWCVDVGK